MPLEQYDFEFELKDYVSPEKTWTHAGVVGSGDMEILVEKADLGGKARAKVLTPASGYENVWQAVLKTLVTQSGIGNIVMEINDNFSTPMVVSARVRQALADLMAPETEA